MPYMDHMGVSKNRGTPKSSYMKTIQIKDVMDRYNIPNSSHGSSPGIDCWPVNDRQPPILRVSLSGQKPCFRDMNHESSWLVKVPGSLVISWHIIYIRIYNPLI